MEKQKIYVVNNVNEFKEWCEKKIGDRMTADDYIELEQLDDREIHIVQRPILIENCIEYDVFTKMPIGWERNDLVSIRDVDIEKLLEEQIIEVLERKKDMLAFKVTDAKKFYSGISNDIKDNEFISMISMLGRQRNNPVIYLINYTDNDFKVLFRDGKINILRELPESVLDKEKILELFKKDIIACVKCEYNEKLKSMRFEKENYFLTDTKNNLRGIIIRSNTLKYVAMTHLRKTDNEYRQSELVYGFGKNESTAIKNLKSRLVSYLDHDTKKIINLYQKQIEKEDYGY